MLFVNSHCTAHPTRPQVSRLRALEAEAQALLSSMFSRPPWTTDPTLTSLTAQQASLQSQARPSPPPALPCGSAPFSAPRQALCWLLQIGRTKLDAHTMLYSIYAERPPR